MSISKTPWVGESSEGPGDPKVSLWALVDMTGKSAEIAHPAGINVWLKTPKGHVYEAQFSTAEILSLLAGQIAVEVDGALTVTVRAV